MDALVYLGKESASTVPPGDIGLVIVLKAEDAGLHLQGAHLALDLTPALQDVITTIIITPVIVPATALVSAQNLTQGIATGIIVPTAPIVTRIVPIEKGKEIGTGIATVTVIVTAIGIMEMSRLMMLRRLRRLQLLLRTM